MMLLEGAVGSDYRCLSERRPSICPTGSIADFSGSLLPPPTTIEWALVIFAGPCLDFRDRFRPPPEISNFRLCIFDLGWIQLIESIRKTAKIVV